MTTEKAFSQENGKGKVLLAIFAHPDDETTISPILAKYTREGAQVHLVIATDGRFGTNDHSDFEAGDTLVAARKKEMQCAADALGVNLIHLEYQDQLRSAEGYDGHIPHIRSLMKEIHSIVDRISPDAIITFGPDGWSNHMDHRLVGASVTQAFLSQKWKTPANLYYVGTPIDHIENPTFKTLKGQQIDYLKTQIAYTEADLKKAYESLNCHTSQIQKRTYKQYKEKKTKNGMLVYLRKFEPPTLTSESVFE